MLLRKCCVKKFLQGIGFHGPGIGPAQDVTVRCDDDGTV